jgi:4-oxalocrotonate tautomerase
MPVLTLQFTPEGVTRQQKAALVQGLTRVIKEVLNRPESLTHIVLQEVDPDNWGVGGVLALDFRRQRDLAG